MSAVPATWPGTDGAPISCTEKIKTLVENHAELQEVMQDAFEDAMLIGVDEAAMRGILHGLVDALRNPKRAR